MEKLVGMIWIVHGLTSLTFDTDDKLFRIAFYIYARAHLCHIKENVLIYIFIIYLLALHTISIQYESEGTLESIFNAHADVYIL